MSTIDEQKQLLEQLKRYNIWDAPTFEAAEGGLEKGLDIERLLSLECPGRAVLDACLALKDGKVWGDKDDELRLEKVAMAVRDASGIPEIFKTYVVVTNEDYMLGNHYDTAIDTAVDFGYEADSHTICFDASEVHNIISAGRHMSDETIYIAWSIDDIKARLEDVGSPYKLTDKQACEILASIDHGHDAEQGVTWDTLDYHTSTYIEEKGIEPAPEPDAMEP